MFGVRLDYNHSDHNRFFGRVSGSNFTEGAGDWTYESAPGLHALSRVRKTRAGTGTWTRVAGDTVIDGQLSANRFLETDQRLGMKGDYTPGSIGLPTYMDDFCKSRGDFGGVTACQLPRINFGGNNLNGNFYQVLGDTSGTFDQGTHYQGQLNLTRSAAPTRCALARTSGGTSVFATSPEMHLATSPLITLTRAKLTIQSKRPRRISAWAGRLSCSAFPPAWRPR